MPVLSAMGIQVCPLPTAVLSSHTGGFEGFTCRDLTEDMAPWAAHWASMGLRFDAVYSGWLGSHRQIGLVEDMIGRFRKENGLVLVDPVLGDDGELYATCTEELVSGMRHLIQEADVITPNVTEAAFLLGKPVPSCEDEALLASWLPLLSEGKRGVVLTGVHRKGRIGALSITAEGERFACFSKEIHRSYPGTGDLFACVLLGMLLQGKTLRRAVAKAVDFTALCAAQTAKLGTPERDGVALEPLLRRLPMGSFKGGRP